MGLTASEGGGGVFTPAPAGTHIARCCWVIDLGHQESTFSGERKVQHKVLIGWELPTELIEEGDREGEPYFLSNFYTVSLHEKSKLRPHLEAWRNRPFTEDELEAFKLANVLDKPCLLSVIHEPDAKGHMRAKVGGVSALMKESCPARVNDLRLYDQDKPDPHVYDELPEWVQGIIDKSMTPEPGGRRPIDGPGPDVVDDESCPF